MARKDEVLIPVNSTYYESIDAMEKSGTDNEYVIGWASGFLGNPKREEQRTTKAYDAGYEDGEAKVTDGYKSWAAA